MNTKQHSASFLAIGLAVFVTQPVTAFEATGAEVTAFLAADADKNLSLSRAEFPTFVRHMARAGQSTARTIVTFKAFSYAFKIADLNGDRKITPQELRSADNTYRAEN